MAGRSDPRAPDRRAGTASTALAASPCDLCGAPTIEVRCKIVCPRCGYTRDCSDP